MEKFPENLVRAPNQHRLVAIDFGDMRLVHQCWNNVTAFEIEIITGPVKIIGLGRDKIAAILLAVGLAHFDAGNFGDGVPLICRLEWSGQ